MPEIQVEAAVVVCKAHSDSFECSSRRSKAFEARGSTLDPDHNGRKGDRLRGGAARERKVFHAHAVDARRTVLK